MAQINLGKIRFTWKGEWSSSLSYELNDTVEYGGTTYVAISTSMASGTLPTSTAHWEVMAGKGDQGVQGVQGLQGL